MRIDLHMHTNASDGALSPTQLVEAALERGLDVISVTDHDTLKGVRPAMDAAAGSALRVLPGVELSGLHEGHSLHLVAYGFDADSEVLDVRLRSLSMGREERARLIVDLLAKMGAPIPWERVTELGRNTIARPHIARVLIEEGHARDVPDAFGRFIGDGCPAYLPSARLTVQEAIALVREAGGEVALGHPLIKGRELDVEALLPVLREAGLTGIEVYHSEHDTAATAYLRALAASEGLWWCGGSDFHGPTKPQAPLGGVNVPAEVLEQGPFVQAWQSVCAVGAGTAR